MIRIWFNMALIGVGASLSGALADEPIAPTVGEHPAAIADWDRSPYRVQLYLQIDQAPAWTAARRKALVAEVADRAAGMPGGVWRADAAEAPAELHWDRASAVARVAIDSIPAAATDCDKVILVGLGHSAGGGASVWSRELDVRTRLWSAALEQRGPALSARTDDVAQQIVRAAWKSFRPFGRIESLTDQGVTLRVRGGGLAAASPALQLAKPGSVWQPIIRHFDAAGRTAKDGVFPIAATWLRTTTVDGATIRCGLVSGVQDPLALEYDGRTEYLALAETGIASSGTSLVCLGHGLPERPLAGLDIWVRDSANQAPRLVGQTDSSGTFRLRSDAPEVLTVYIRGGDDLLTQFPLVPGLESSMMLRLDDSGRRLQSAQLAAAVRVELLDLATQQRLLVARFQREVIDGQSDNAGKTIAALRSLPTAEQFLTALDAKRARLTTILADPKATAWLDKKLEEIKAAAPANLLHAADLQKLESVVSPPRQ